MSEEQYPVRTYALMDEDGIVKYIQTYSLASQESWSGNYEGVKSGRPVDLYDYPITIGMKWDGEINQFVNP
jgi:hypothetical protein